MVNYDLIQLFTGNIYRRCFAKWASSVPASLLKPMSIFVTPDDFVSNIGSLKSQSAKNGDTSINVALLSDPFCCQGLLADSIGSEGSMEQ